MIRIAYLLLNYKTFLDTICVTEDILRFQAEDDFIVIVDNRSPNESSIELHKRYDDNTQVAVVDAPNNGGYAKGNNVGLQYLEHLSPQYVCIINNDVHFTGEVMDYLVRIYPLLPDVGVVSPLQLMPDKSKAQFPVLKLPDFEYDIRSYLFFHGNPPHKYECNTLMNNIQEVGVIPGAFLFIDYKLFQSIGFFDEITFLYCEERFLSHKLFDAGRKNYILLDKYYIHDHSKTISSESTERKRMRLMFDGRLKYTRKYMRFPLVKTTLLYLVYYYNIFVRTVIHHC